MTQELQRGLRGISRKPSLWKAIRLRLDERWQEKNSHRVRVFFKAQEADIQNHNIELIDTGAKKIISTAYKAVKEAHTAVILSMAVEMGMLELCNRTKGIFLKEGDLEKNLFIELKSGHNRTGDAAAALIKEMRNHIRIKEKDRERFKNILNKVHDQFSHENKVLNGLFAASQAGRKDWALFMKKETLGWFITYLQEKRLTNKEFVDAKRMNDYENLLERFLKKLERTEKNFLRLVKGKAAPTRKEFKKEWDEIKRDLKEIEKDTGLFLDCLEEGTNAAFKFFMHDSINLQACIACLMGEKELLKTLKENWEIPTALEQIDQKKAEEVIKYMRASLEDVRVAINQMESELQKARL